MSDWSSYKKDQLIMESWRNFLSEDLEPGTLTKTYDPSSYEKSRVVKGKDAPIETPEFNVPSGSACQDASFISDALAGMLNDSSTVQLALKPISEGVDRLIDRGLLVTGGFGRIATGINMAAGALGVSVGDLLVKAAFKKAVSTVLSKITDPNNTGIDIATVLTTLLGREKAQEICNETNRDKALDKTQFALQGLSEPQKVIGLALRLAKGGFLGFKVKSELELLQNDAVSIGGFKFKSGSYILDTITNNQKDFTDYFELS